MYIFVLSLFWGFEQTKHLIWPYMTCNAKIKFSGFLLPSERKRLREIALTFLRERENENVLIITRDRKKARCFYTVQFCKRS